MGDKEGTNLKSSIWKNIFWSMIVVTGLGNLHLKGFNVERYGAFPAEASELTDKSSLTTSTRLGVDMCILLSYNCDLLLKQE